MTNHAKPAPPAALPRRAALALPAHADPDDYLARRAELGPDEVTRRFLGGAGVGAVFVDHGFAAGGLLAPSALGAAAGAAVGEVVRLEAVAEDVADLARDVLRHRLVLTYDALGDGVSADDVLGRILGAVGGVREQEAEAEEGRDVEHLARVAARHGPDLPEAEAVEGAAVGDEHRPDEALGQGHDGRAGEGHRHRRAGPRRHHRQGLDQHGDGDRGAGTDGAAPPDPPAPLGDGREVRDLDVCLDVGAGGPQPGLIHGRPPRWSAAVPRAPYARG